MDTTGKEYGEENTGVANLANSLDMITWWALMTFFHCDEKACTERTTMSLHLLAVISRFCA
ncbi:MAG: hypothetical protein CM1200mP21_06520 [Candidatus Poseidoniales archaeon]|nr:MAG: hypothetical protein CM1200mP21_06520 [Candidatus Poseidoniales archaeon]